MKGCVCISDVKLETVDGFNVLSALIDEDRIYLSVPEKIKLVLSVEFFLGIALLEAMARNEPIEIESSVPLSFQLHEQLKELQSIYASWNTDLNIIDIRAEISGEVNNHSKVGSFFSAGVDSSHTLLCHKDEITHLLMCRSFDQGRDQVSWDSRLLQQTAFAASLGKTLVPIETNAREWMIKRKISWHFGHGLLLCSMGGALGMKKLFVPSSFTYDALFPWGSHPLSDPMWSTESTLVIHHGASHRRTEKTKEILSDERIANNLQVCWASIHKNCGKCSKCIRSMTAIYLLEGHILSLAKLDDIDSLKIMRPTSEAAADAVKDLMILARQVDNIEVYRMLNRYYRRYQISHTLAAVDRYLLNGLLRKLHRKIKPPEWVSWRVTLRSPSHGDI